MTSRGPGFQAVSVAVAVIVIAALSLLLPFSPVFDPWAWAVWGRELAGFDLDTGGGPSWKPLPVGLTALFSVAGDAAPELWLVVARAGWLLVPLLAWRLAGRLAPERFGGRERLAAAAIAALGVLLLHDPFTSLLRQFAGGLSEPLLVALVLAAVDRQLADRPGQALALAAVAALLRPETWPLLAVYGVWLARARAVRPAVLVAVAIGVPALWLVPDLLGSGDALTGASRARSATGSPIPEGFESIGRSLDLVLWGLWPAAAYAALGAHRRGDSRVVAVGALALAWIGVVAAMAAFGYAGLPRFAAPAAALVCVLGAIGLVELAADAVRVRALVAGAIAVSILVQASIRIGELPGEVERAADFDEGVESLAGLVDRAGPRIVACGAVDTTDFYTQTALAWELDRPLDGVGVRSDSVPLKGVIVVAPGSNGRAPALAKEQGRLIGAHGGWEAYAVSCASARASRMVGVTGARR
jgi:hypothetical protein